ncbi:hypothetical protein KKH23_05645 [Patescibacteria group bacterium]|nr:hypothetical protein [Patescibacteria group bacterium]
MITEESAKLLRVQADRLSPHTERIFTDNPDLENIVSICDSIAWAIIVKAGVGVAGYAEVVTFVMSLAPLMYSMGYLRAEAKDNIFEKMVVARDVAGG